MSRRVLDRIADIRQAIDRCQRFAEFSGTSDQAINDEIVAYAIERNLEIIGEAARHLPEEVTVQFPHIPWKQIKGFRNVLAHEYFALDGDVISAILATHLADLDRAMRQIEDQGIG